MHIIKNNNYILIKNYISKNKISEGFIVDFFSGSGTTALTAKETIASSIPILNLLCVPTSHFIGAFWCGYI